MGYETILTGEIEIVPPIPWKHVRESFFLPENARRGGKLDKHVMFRVEQREVETDEGTLVSKRAVALVPTHSSYAGNIVAHVQEVVNAFPEHEFRGRIDARGEDTETPDVWRLKVVNRVATKFEPKLVWPEESE